MEQPQQNPEQFRKQRQQDKEAFVRARTNDLITKLRQLTLAANSDYKSFAAFSSRHTLTCLSRQISRYDFEKLKFSIHGDDALKNFARLLLAADYDDQTSLQLGEKPKNFRKAWSVFINSSPQI